MSKTIRYGDNYQKKDHRGAGRPRRARRLSARAIHREEVDTSRIARAVIQIALSEAEREVEAREVGMSGLPEGDE
ncbi:MAG: hypothetical protein QM809_17230 [Gordonia sp. (in: high G+C Gram-positive bacteria)]|uniref:hypothetical protein n=1 Tax=Gordonia sp. (in: high G+C Gram-positive bacteria) TaxID=84139 RepID=UPI0039E23EA9